MSKVSVIIPYYKKKLYIKKTIKSVIRQTHQNLEVIIVYDDEDKSDLNYIKSIINFDKRIRLIINKKNVGAGVSRNIAIKSSKGQFISFLDSDDLWSRTKIEKQLNLLRKTRTSICHTSYYVIDSKDKIKGLRIAKNYLNYQSLLKSCDIGLSTVLMRKQVLNNKNLKFPNLKTKEDFVLWLRILQDKNQIYSLNEKLAKWRKLGNSLSSSVFQKLIDGYRVYYQYMNYNIFKSIYFVLCLSINFLKKR